MLALGLTGAVPLDLAGAANLFLDDGDDLLVSYSDILYEPKVIEAVKNCDAPVAIAVNECWRTLWQQRMTDPLADAETMKRDNNEFIRELGKKAKNYSDVQGQYMGVFKVRADHVRKLSRSITRWTDCIRSIDWSMRPDLYMTSFLQHLIDLESP